MRIFTRMRSVMTATIGIIVMVSGSWLVVANGQTGDSRIEGAPTLGDREPVLKEGGPLARRPLGLSKKQTEKIISRMM